jgi:microcystin-dependent protein
MTSQNPFIGEIQICGFNFAPRGWAFCDGQLLSISSNQALFALLGTIYGGDGRTTFGLPDLRGRLPIHEGAGPGLPTYRLGQKGGKIAATLTEQNLPQHSHTLKPRCSNSGGAAKTPAGNYHAVGGDYISTHDATMADQETDATGGGQAFPVQSPYLALNFVIALVGIFPSRN